MIGAAPTLTWLQQPLIRTVINIGLQGGVCFRLGFLVFFYISLGLRLGLYLKLLGFRQCFKFELQGGGGDSALD